MKRSKMVESLAIKLYSELNGTSIEENKDLAHHVLLFLENSGMLPPYHPTKGYEAAESHGTGTLTYYRKQFNEWEEE